MRFFGLLVFLPALVLADWPQAAGPDGTWRVRVNGKAPVSWSVALNKNIGWRTTLPNGGQSGITVSGDHVVLTTFDDGESKFSAKILGHALDRETGKILWSVKLEGSVKSPMMYAYSDSTSPSPATDGKYVWFVNSSGEMGCFDFSGKEIWRRKWEPADKPFPFNKQFEPILYGDTIVNLERAKDGWHYLHGLDKLTGKVKWVAEDSTTAYNTPVFGKRADGVAAILHGRGGWHDVPERPVGLSMTDFTGKTLWRFVAGDGNEQAPTWQALYTMTWDRKYAYWFRLNPEETHLVFDSSTGKVLREQSLIRNVDYRQWDPAANKYIVHTGVNLREVRELSPRNKLAADEVIRVMPAWHANIAIDGYHYFMTTVAHRRNRVSPKGKAGPSHCIARVNVETGKVEYLEVPVTVIRTPGEAEKKVYGIAVKTKTLNSKGVDVADEERSRTDGWEIPAFWGTPTAVNDQIYFTTMLGITYVIDAKAKVLDQKALLAVNDLGPSGETWSLNSVSFSHGRLYHRSLKEVVEIK